MSAEFYRDRKVVVTGGGGFIGSHLVEALARQGAHVRALVRYTSTASHGHLDGLDPTLAPRVEIVVGNVEDAAAMRGLIRGADTVFHLAALIGIPYSYVAPHQYVATNVVGTLNVLEAAREHGVRRLVHTSTSETYGTALYTPIDEKHPLQGQSPYSASKIGADKLAESYHLSFEVPVATIRPFNTYGPRQSSRAFIPTVMKQLAAGRDRIVMGSPEPSRDLNFVEDTVEGFLAIGESDACVGETVNIGSGRTITMGDLARKIIDASGKKAEVVVDPSRIRPAASEVMMLLASTDKAKQLCGYEPRVRLEDGLARAYAYVSDNLHRYEPDAYVI